LETFSNLPNLFGGSVKFLLPSTEGSASREKLKYVRLFVTGQRLKIDIPDFQSPMDGLINETT
jgi:hypothetical protein